MKFEEEVLIDLKNILKVVFGPLRALVLPARSSAVTDKSKEIVIDGDCLKLALPLVDVFAILRNRNCFDEFVGFPALGNFLGPINDLAIGVQEIEMVGAWDQTQSVISFARKGLHGRELQNQTEACSEV